MMETSKESEGSKGVVGLAVHRTAQKNYLQGRFLENHAGLFGDGRRVRFSGGVLSRALGHVDITVACCLLFCLIGKPKIGGLCV